MGTPPRVDRLVGVPDHKETGGSQELDQIHLHPAGVLVLVDENVGPPPVQAVPKFLVFHQKLPRQQDQVIKVEGVVREEFFSVPEVDLASHLHGSSRGSARCVGKGILPLGKGLLDLANGGDDLDRFDLGVLEIDLLLLEALVENPDLFPLVDDDVLPVEPDFGVDQNFFRCAIVIVIVTVLIHGRNPLHPDRLRLGHVPPDRREIPQHFTVVPQDLGADRVKGSQFHPLDAVESHRSLGVRPPIGGLRHRNEFFFVPGR
mmetsp:Transcript_6919/g.17366  ORF Transcript_6919/g.17366 Transcript_6919/m.17366 type:complete len:260 (+) Transcript_6919:1983-2762(+)